MKEYDRTAIERAARRVIGQLGLDLTIFSCLQPGTMKEGIWFVQFLNDVPDMLVDPSRPPSLEQQMREWLSRGGYPAG